MNKDDIAEMYNQLPKPDKKKQYTGIAWVVDKQGNQQTNKLDVAITKSIFKRDYKHLKGYRVYHEFNWVECN